MKTMVHTGLVSATFKSRPYQEVIEAALTAGLEAIEWSENHHVPYGNCAAAKAIADATVKAGLKVAGYGSYYRLGQGMDIVPSLGNARAMGASSMRIWAGSKASCDLDGTSRAALVAELKDAAAIAGRYGIVLNLEWHKNTLTDTNESGLALLKEVDSPFLRTLWQPTQALGFDQRAEGLGMIMPYLSYMHVYYWDESGRRPLEEGTGHWNRYFSLLDPQKDYYALLEFVKGDTLEQFYEDAATLKGLLHIGE